MQNEYLIIEDIKKQKNLSKNSAYWSNFLYSNAITIAYECNDGLVKTIIKEFKKH